MAFFKEPTASPATQFFIIHVRKYTHARARVHTMRAYLERLPSVSQTSRMENHSFRGSRRTFHSCGTRHPDAAGAENNRRGHQCRVTGGEEERDSYS